MLRGDDVLDEAMLLIRAIPGSIAEAFAEIADDALLSAATYVVDRQPKGRLLLYGVSVFARPPPVGPTELLRRFPGAPRYLEARAGDVKAAGFEVLGTGADLAHFDVLLVGNQSEDPPVDIERTGPGCGSKFSRGLR